MDYPLKGGSKTNDPELIVIHAMGEYIEWEPEDLWAPAFLEKIGLSVHILITPDGTIIRCREDNQGAWHAKNFNTNSLGIEFLVKGHHTYETFRSKIKESYITAPQYDAGVEQVREWIEKHHIESIKAHSELSPRRKFDPGMGFPMTTFIQDVFS